MWELILKALLKELETNPDRIFAIIERILKLFENNPQALGALVGRIPTPQA